MRLMVEPALAFRAAERASLDDIALLRRSIVDHQTEKNNRVKLVASDPLACGDEPAAPTYDSQLFELENLACLSSCMC